MASDPKVPMTPYETKKNPIEDDYDLGDVLGSFVSFFPQFSAFFSLLFIVFFLAGPSLK